MRLAKEMGRVDWRKMLSEMTPQELAEWLAYYRIEPFGREWHQISSLGAGICNDIRHIAGSLGAKNLETLQEDAFLPQFIRASDKKDDPLDALDGLIGLPT